MRKTAYRLTDRLIDGPTDRLIDGPTNKMALAPLKIGNPENLGMEENDYEEKQVLGKVRGGK